jgi:hypothetical protein
MKRRKLLLLAAAGLTGALVIGATTGADASANANLALSITGGQTHRSAHTAFQVNNNVGLSVADANRAQASSVGCVDCKTVAAAVQVDLAAGPVVSIHAINKAVAVERSTVNSDTCAMAYQFVIAPNARVVFSASGKADIAAVQAAVRAEVASSASCADIQASVAASMDTLGGVLGDPGSYAPGDPSGPHLLPRLNVNRYQDNQAA